MALALRQACFRAALWLATLPESHPLHPLFRTGLNVTSSPTGPRYMSLRYYWEPPPDRVECITPVRPAPAHELKAKIRLSELSEEAEDALQGDQSCIRLFSDGSGLDGGIGAAAVMYRPGWGPRVLRFHLSPLTDHTVFEAEAVGHTVGVILALHMLHFKCDAKRAIIQLDNQAILGALSLRGPRPSQYLIDEITWQIDSIWEWACDPAFRLEIGWVRGHNGTEGNEKVDGEAKEATKGCTSTACNLPSFLTDETLPLSSSATKQASDTLLHGMWRSEWATSPRFSKLSRIDPSMPSNGFCKLASKLSRAQASTLIQLRSGHIPLAKHLFRISKALSPVCPSCQSDEETVHHFLFDCPTWQHKHWSMGWMLGPKAKSVDHILNNQKGVEVLLKFVRSTRWLKCPAGDASPGT